MSCEAAVSRAVRVIEDDIPAVLLAVMVLLLSADVLGRYVWNHPISWATEICQICFIWLVYLASVGVMRRRRHIAIEILRDRLTGRSKAVLDGLVSLVVAAALTLLTWHAYQFVTATTFADLPATGLSRRYVGIAVLVTAAGMLVHGLAQLWAAALGMAGGPYTVQAESLGEIDDLEQATAPPSRETVAP